MATNTCLKQHCITYTASMIQYCITMATYTCLKQQCITLHCLNDTILHHHGNEHLPESTMYHPALPQ
ncbi:Hypothetical predicted protein [Pelobates cultripes]|uniref:Uncharacterized protein n=1 Tax=Pelobates cultripes TaxID=61616 RepID=A0AAD1T6A4_PELCU|nr:Hypothetical predicted protein [Pelobates cultripes]